MKISILLLTVAFISTCVLISQVLGQQCTSNYISSFSPTDVSSSKASNLVCPTGFINGFGFNGNRTCLSIQDTILPTYKGMACASSTICAANWLGCAASSSTCEFRRTRILGDSCTHRENCVGSFGTSSSFANCHNNYCVSFKIQNIVAIEGGDCQDRALNETTNIIKDCAPGFQCYLGKCQKVTYDSDEGGTCGTVTNSVYVNCKQNANLICINYVCYKPTYLQLGQNCTGFPVSTVCADGLVCRKENANAIAKTCQVPSVYNDYCESASDCYKLPILLMRCANNKCIRRYSRLDGEDCENSADCFNNFCENKKCTSRTVGCTSACQTGTDWKCGCGGLSSATPFNGTCVNPCNGYREDFYACAYNNGLDEITSGFQSTNQFQPVDANSTVITKLCSKQYSNMVKCYKQTWIDTGMYDTSFLTRLSGVDISGPLVMPTSLTNLVIGRNLTSPSPKVAVSVSILSQGVSLTSSLTFVFSLIFICLSFMM